MTTSSLAENSTTRRAAIDPLNGYRLATPSRRIPAWLMSTVLHGMLLILLAMAVRIEPQGAAIEPSRAAGIVLARATAKQTEYLDESDTNAAGQSQAEATDSTRLDAAEALPAAGKPPVDLAGALPAADGASLTGLGADLGAALPAAGDLTTGTGPSRRISGKAHTYVFGIEGEGTNFAYVFDRSASMSGYAGRPLAAAKRELIHSLKSLQSTHQFQILFYNDELSVFNPNPTLPAQLMFATEANKQMAEHYVQAIVAAGGTRHMTPLSLALRMAPDVIFFLTDAAEPQLSPANLSTLRRLNSGTIIHAIEFGAGPFPGGDNFLMKLARQNNGRHTYVDVTRLSGE